MLSGMWAYLPPWIVRFCAGNPDLNWHEDGWVTISGPAW